jgi:hypothetical protein
MLWLQQIEVTLVKLRRTLASTSRKVVVSIRSRKKLEPRAFEGDDVSGRTLHSYNHIRSFVIVWLFLYGSSFASEQPLKQLAPLPAGITLPVTLDKTLNEKHIRPGERISATLYQRVPLGNGFYLPRKTRILGRIVDYDHKSLAVQWTDLQLEEQTQPIAVKLVAAADWTDVQNTKLPLGATDRSMSNPANWTTMQIGRDEVYRSGWSGTVYNQYSEPVGKADAHGVYAAPQSPGELSHAMGPFSTTSTGLDGLQGMTLISGGTAKDPIIFHLENHRWQFHAGDALLLEVVSAS